MSTRDRFTGADPAYLRTEQYVDGRRVTSRMQLMLSWSTAPVRWYTWVLDELDRLGWFPTTRVLEIGSGTGALWAESFERLQAASRLVVTDSSIGMVREATARLPGVRTAVVDAHAVPFRDGHFDRVVANHVLYHLADPDSAVRELARVLRPDGTMIAATIGRRHLTELAAIRQEAFGGRSVDRTTAVFGIDTGEPIMQRNFREVTWLSYPGTIVCREPDDVLAFLESTPPLDAAGPRTKERVRRAILRRFDEDGAFRITQETGLFVGRMPRSAAQGHNVSGAKV